MKKFILFVFLTALSLDIVSAQNFTVEPNPAIFDEESLDLSDEFADFINHTVLTNNTTGDVALGWKRTILSAPSEWEFQICDKNLCYNPPVDEPSVAVELEPDSTSILDLHVKPKGVPGCAFVELTVSPFSNPNNVLLTVMYEVKINNPGACLSSAENVFIEKLRVYPNPTEDLFQISELENVPEASEIAVYNLVGNKVKSFAPNQSEYRVSDLPNGLYLVSIIDENQGVLRTVRMSKNSLRP